jgi:hypothetical protein
MAHRALDAVPSARRCAGVLVVVYGEPRCCTHPKTTAEATPTRAVLRHARLPVRGNCAVRPCFLRAADEGAVTEPGSEYGEGELPLVVAPSQKRCKRGHEPVHCTAQRPVAHDPLDRHATVAVMVLLRGCSTRAAAASVLFSKPEAPKSPPAIAPSRAPQHPLLYVGGAAELGARLLCAAASRCLSRRLAAREGLARAMR